jgi:hypothetical protein
MVQEVLAGLSVEQLQQIVKDKELASIGPMVTEYNEREDRLLELRLKIQKSRPDWEPPKLDDRIFSWVNKQDAHTATGSAIRAEFIKRRGNYPMPVKNAINSLVTSKRLTVDKNDNYLVVNAS